MKRALSYPAGFFMKTKKTTFICEIIEIIIYLKHSRKMEGPTPVWDSNDHFVSVRESQWTGSGWFLQWVVG